MVAKRPSNNLATVAFSFCIVQSRTVVCFFSTALRKPRWYCSCILILRFLVLHPTALSPGSSSRSLLSKRLADPLGPAAASLQGPWIWSLRLLGSLQPHCHISNTVPGKYIYATETRSIQLALTITHLPRGIFNSEFSIKPMPIPIVRSESYVEQ